jgi:hypothetical protein
LFFRPTSAIPGRLILINDFLTELYKMVYAKGE